MELKGGCQSETQYFEYSRNTVDGADDWAHRGIMKIDDAAARLEALGNRTRLQIYRALVRAGHPGMPVGRLQEKLKIPASTLSHHIKTLVAVGLVSQVRESTTLICHANFDAMRGLVDFLAAECCADEVGCKDAQTAA
jgi:DNA-binding transcriptional ArsR family regulator